MSSFIVSKIKNVIIIIIIAKNDTQKQVLLFSFCVTRKLSLGEDICSCSLPLKSSPMSLVIDSSHPLFFNGKSQTLFCGCHWEAQKYQGMDGARKDDFSLFYKIIFIFQDVAMT